MRIKAIIYSITISFIILFLYTGIIKLHNWQEFQQQLRLSPLTAPLARPLTIVVPAIELILVIALIVAKWRKAGFIATFTLMFLFTIYMIVLVNWYYYLPCGCGGVLEQLPANIHITINIILTIMAGVGWWLTVVLLKKGLPY